jgi:hypothetical protein
MWLGLYLPIRSFHPYSTQTDSESYKSYHVLSARLAEQLRPNRSALAELTQHSPVRAVLEEVIRTLILILLGKFEQLKVTGIQLTSASRA